MFIPSFIFLRHGQSCQNLVRKLRELNKLNPDADINELVYDATLTESAIPESKRIGLELAEWIEKENLNVKFVCSSPMIRAIETAVYMTGISPIVKEKPVYVMPYLREVDSKRKKNTVKHVDKKFPLREIQYQKEYLTKTGIIDRVRFDYVERHEDLRKQPGNISEFIRWFIKKSITDFKQNDVVVVVCHSGVMKQYFGSGFTNNNGFIIRSITEEIPLSKAKSNLKCSEDRCNSACNV